MVCQVDMNGLHCEFQNFCKTVMAFIIFTVICPHRIMQHSHATRFCMLLRYFLRHGSKILSLYLCLMFVHACICHKLFHGTK